MSLPPTHTLRLTDTVSMSFRLIPAGRFRMGARGHGEWEEPCHDVEISRPFDLGEFPVTPEEFAVWTGEHQPPDGPHENHFARKLRHPAESLSWRDAVAFCAWLNDERRNELPLGYLAALPSEAEWEYACRAGTDTEHHTGDGEEALRSAGWFGEEWETGSTHEVGGRQANAFDLHDMHGNVWEWCWDAWDEDAYKKRADGSVDPVVDAGTPTRAIWLDKGGELPQDSRRVLRGGSWYNSTRRCRSAYRNKDWPAYRTGSLGFRVCVVPGPDRKAKGKR